jgi:hypothetical protein
MLQGNNTEITVKKYTSSSKKGAKDRRFIADAIYSIIKNYRFMSLSVPHQTIQLSESSQLTFIKTIFFLRNRKIGILSKQQKLKS